MKPSEFYGRGHRGDAFGIVRIINGVRSIHRGLDINRWPRGTRIPLWSTGTIARIDRDDDGALGRTVSVRRADGWFAGYCHLDSIDADLHVGQAVVVGEQLFTLGNTGTVTTGAHLHTVLGLSSDPASGVVADPAPHIDALLTSQAGETGTPLPEELDMAGITILPKARRIIWPNGWLNAYDPNVLEAIRLVVEEGDTEPTRIATFDREAWRAVDGMLRRQATVLEQRAADG